MKFSISVLLRHKRLLAVVPFLGVPLAVFELSGLRDHFNIEFSRVL
jgi:hypothetical protein